jgi:hypothetical protein
MSYISGMLLDFPFRTKSNFANAEPLFVMLPAEVVALLFYLEQVYT